MRILSCLEVRDQTRVPQDPHVVQLSLHPRFHGALPLVENAMKKNALPFVRAAQGLVKESGAMEMEVSFGLGISGEVGNVAVGKAGAESNYTVTLKWTQPEDG